MSGVTLVCEQCKKDFITIRKTVKFCSNECRINFNTNKKANELANQPDTVKCLECNFIGKSLVTHINLVHKMSVPEYKLKHNVDTESICSQSTRKKLSELSSGENNVWYNHRGKMSSFSKNNTKITEEQRKENQVKAIQNRIDNGKLLSH